MEKTPFILDFVVELPQNAEVESLSMSRDCVTWGDSGCDDD